MSKCKHEYRLNTNQWSQVCKYCDRSWNDIEIAILEAQVAELLAACERVIESFDAAMAVAEEDCPYCRSREHHGECPYIAATAALAKVKGEDDE